MIKSLNTKQKKPIKNYKCPYCKVAGLTLNDLRNHCNANHSLGQKNMVCPVCVSMPWGNDKRNPNQKSIDFIGHLNFRHRFEYEDFVDINSNEDVMLEQTIKASLAESRMNSMISSTSSMSISNRSASSNSIVWSSEAMDYYDITFYKPVFAKKIADIPNTSLTFESNTNQLWMSPTEFASGAMRSAHASLVKWPIKDVFQKAVIKKMKKENAPLKEYLDMCENQMVASLLSEKFFEVSRNKKFMRYIDLNLVMIPKYGYQSTAYFNIEEYVDGNFSKWSNNYGYVNEDIYSNTLDAFSHWTYEVTNGFLLVHDLQGFKSSDGREYILTDPAISCPTSLTRFGRTNMGSDGIKKFFESHRCNQICIKLNLKRNKYQNSSNRKTNLNSSINSITGRYN